MSLQGILFSIQPKYTWSWGPVLWVGMILMTLVYFGVGYFQAYTQFLQDPDPEIFAGKIKTILNIGFTLLGTSCLGAGAQLFIENNHRHKKQETHFLVGFGLVTRHYNMATTVSMSLLLGGMIIISLAFSGFFETI